MRQLSRAQCFRAFACAVSLSAAYGLWSASSLPALRMVSPQAALARYPDDAEALSASLLARSQKTGTVSISSSERARLQRALIAQPLHVPTLLLMAQAEEQAGQTQKATSLLWAAQRVSRRDLAHQAAMLELNAARNDIPATLGNYHALLSVHPEVAPLLYPQLIKALTYAPAREALRPYARDQARWMPGFLTMATDQAPLASVVPFMISASPFLKAEPYRAATARALFRLAEQGDARATAAFAQRLIPGFQPSTLTQLAPNAATTDERIGALSWAFTQSASASATLTEDGQLRLTVAPLARATLAARHMMLDAGQTYKFSYQVRSPNAPATALQIKWQFSCRPQASNTPFWTSNSVAVSGTASLEQIITIPSNCPLTYMTISGSGPDAQFSASGSIFNLTIGKARLYSAI